MFWLSRWTYSGVPGCGPAAFACGTAAAASRAATRQKRRTGVALPAGMQRKTPVLLRPSDGVRPSPDAVDAEGEVLPEAGDFREGVEGLGDLAVVPVDLEVLLLEAAGLHRRAELLERHAVEPALDLLVAAGVL